MAIEDARGVDASAVLFDEQHATYVVAGPRGRTHFFTGDGKLVSSVRYSRDAVERKRKLGMWSVAAPEPAQRLLEILRSGAEVETPPGS